jgi:hypothetical protein
MLLKKILLEKEYASYRYRGCTQYYGCHKYNKCYKCKCYKQHEAKTKLIIKNVTLSPATVTSLNINIFGCQFNKVKKVNINDLVITNFTLVNDNEIIVNVPEITGNGLVISVASCYRVSNTITYNPDPGQGFVPTITGISPGSGSMGPLINITISGTNLATLKSISCDNLILRTTDYPVSVISDTMISFILPFINPVKNIPISVKTIFGSSNTVYYYGISRPII